MISPFIRKREAIRRLASESSFLGERAAAQRMLAKEVPLRFYQENKNPSRPPPPSSSQNLKVQTQEETNNE